MKIQKKCFLQGWFILGTVHVKILLCNLIMHSLVSWLRDSALHWSKFDHTSQMQLRAMPLPFGADHYTENSRKVGNNPMDHIVGLITTLGFWSRPTGRMCESRIRTIFKNPHFTTFCMAKSVKPDIFKRPHKQDHHCKTWICHHQRIYGHLPVTFW